MTKDEMKNKVKELVALGINGQGEVRPFILGDAPDGKLVIMDVAMLMTKKDTVAALITKMRSVMRVVAFVSESWMVTIPVGGDTNIAPSEHPDRYEAVMACIYQGMTVELIHAAMIRNGDKVSLSDWHENLENPSGRMATAPAEWN
jgi:hypothetical protein